MSGALTRLREMPSRLATRRTAARLIASARYDEAEALIQSSLANAPYDRTLLLQHATCAHNQGHYAVARTRWERLRACHADADIAWSGVAANAREEGDIAYARAIVVEGLARFPDSVWVMSEAARVFDRNNEPGEAVKLWRRLCDTGKSNPDWHARLGKTLLQLERFAEAEASIAHGLHIAPNHMNLKHAQGLAAVAQERWDEALDLWSALAREYPDDEVPRGYVTRIKGVKKLADAEALHQGLPTAQRAVAAEPFEAVRDLMLKFEGIGIDCEFGTVQRYFGAEPIGLLRWNDTNFSALMAALSAKFEGIGDPANTELTTGQYGEYYLRDKRWGLDMHTLLYSHEIAAATLFPKMCRRMSYLRDKLLEDLATGEKILVYKSEEPMDQISTLHRAFKSFGPVHLLNVRRTTAEGPIVGRPGEVIAVQPDLHVGFIERIGDLHNIAHEDWKTICLALSDARRDAVQRTNDDH